MRLPRFRLRTLLIAVAIVAASLGWFARPYPFEIRVGGGPTQFRWSNGWVTEQERADPVPRRWRIRGPLVAVDWTDGATTWHLRVPYKCHWVWWRSAESGY
jgi:hypothetical protein